MDSQRVRDNPDQLYDSQSAHTTDHDPWPQVGALLVTAFNCGYTLSFSNLIMVPLGWIWGIICLTVMGIYTAYANWLLAGFHFIDGRRFIRYRDIMGYLFGRKMYYVTWVIQFVLILLGNMAFILLGARAVKELSADCLDSPLRLQYCIIITGAAYFVFANMIPTLSDMKAWLGVSLIITFTYNIILLTAIVKDGKSNTHRNYDISGGDVGLKVLNAFGSIAAIIVANTSGLLLEIQSTVRKPAVSNMRKALVSQYTVGLAFYYGVCIVGYWAYGSVVSDYLPEDISGPKWVKIFVNFANFVQSVISQHMFVSPIHETIDTKFLKLDEGLRSGENLKRRFLLRAVHFSFNTFVTAAFPFIGDFVNLLGSFALVPLTFVFPSMIYLKVKGNNARLEKQVWHWFNIVLFSIITVVTTVSAIRLIVNNVQKYSFFADY